jgi:hypothetical protein
VGSTTHADKRHSDFARSVGDLELEGATSLDTLLSKTRDERSVSESTILLEQVRRLEDLSVSVVSSLITTSSRTTDLVDVAKTTTTDKDSGIGKENGNRVVVARNSVGSKLSPFVGSGVVKLRDEDTVGVGKDHSPALTTSNKDSSIREDNSVTKTTGESHIGDTLDGSRLVSLTKSGDVGVLVGIGVGVVGSTSSRQDLTVESIVHDKDTAHGVDIISLARQTDRSLLLGAVPVLSSAGASLEDTATLPSKQPSVVILTPDTLMVLGKHRLDIGSSEHGPLVGLGIVDLTVFALAGTGVGSSNGEDTAVRQNSGGLVTTRHLHVRSSSEGVILGVVKGDSLSIGTTLDNDTTIAELAHTRAEHVVVGVSNLTSGNVSSGKIESTELSATRGTTESIGAPRREEEELLRLRELGNDVGSYGNKRKTNDVRPATLGSRLDSGRELNNAESLALNPEKRSVGLSSLDVADLALVIIDSLLASLDVGALISTSCKRSDVLDLSSRSTDKVSVVADVESLALALESTVLVTTSGTNGNELSFIDVGESDGIKVLVLLPVHAIRVVLVLDMADAVLLVVDGLDTSGVLVADLGASIGVSDILDNLETGSSVLVVGVSADGVVSARLGSPSSFL